MKYVSAGSFQCGDRFRRANDVPIFLGRFNSTTADPVKYFSILIHDMFSDESTQLCTSRRASSLRKKSETSGEERDLATKRLVAGFGRQASTGSTCTVPFRPTRHCHRHRGPCRPDFRSAVIVIRGSAAKFNICHRIFD